MAKKQTAAAEPAAAAVVVAGQQAADVTSAEKAGAGDPADGQAGAGAVQAVADALVAGQAAAEAAAAAETAREVADADRAAADAEAARAPVLVPVRVLVDGAYGAVNDVVHIAADLVSTAEASGEVDSHPAAVAYAHSLKT